MPITIQLTDQQRELLDASIAAAEAPDMAGLVDVALRESATSIPLRPLPAPRGRVRRWREALEFTPSTERTPRSSVRLAPGTGKAIEVRTGQIVRVAQVDGNQCADINVFNLHDYREVLHVGRTRTLHGIHPTQGDFLWSAPPRERAMMYILTDTANLNDTLFPRCSANMYESLFGFAEHTNCADIQAEAQREYGLTPDDVHDSFNLFMGTEVRSDGSCAVITQDTSPDDHIELLALMDLLVVPNVCGNDMFSTSNHALRPLDVSVADAGIDDLNAVPQLKEYDTQRTPADFSQPNIRVDRELRRDPDYRAAFPRTPVTTHEVTVDLDGDLVDLFVSLAPDVDPTASTAGLALRELLITWWTTTHAVDSDPSLPTQPETQPA